MSTKRIAAICGLLGLALTVDAVPVWAQKGPIKVGFLTQMTGGGAAVGKDMSNGFMMSLEEISNQIAGRKVEVILEDTQGDPAQALTRLRKLAESDKVHAVAGIFLANEGYALAPKVDEYRIPTVWAVVSADDLTQRKPTKWAVRTGWTSSQPNHPFGEYAAKTLGYKRVVTIAMDYAFGWEQVGGFQKTFEESGGQIVQKLWPPLGTTDFGPYLSQIKRDVDAVYAVFSGADALRFAKQYEDAGLKARLPLIGGGTFTDEHVLRTMGDDALGVITALHYSAALNNPVNRKFVQAYEAKLKQVPSYYSEGTYVAGLQLKRALESIGGDAENTERLVGALRKVELTDTPRGPIRFDEYGNPIQNIYVRKVERVGGKLQNTVIYTFQNVSQFWTYKPDEYLKNPVYSRDYPPCKYC